MTPGERDALVNLLDECGRLVALRLEHYRSSGFVGDSPLLNRINAAIAALTAHPSAAEPVAQVLSIDEQSKVIPNETFVAIVPHGQSAPPIGTKLYAHPAQPAESVGDGGRKAYEDCIAKLQGLQINLTDVPEYAADYAARVAKATLLGCISEIRQRVTSLPAAPTPAASGDERK